MSASSGIEGIGLGQLRRGGSEGRLEDFGRSDDADSNWQGYKSAAERATLPARAGPSHVASSINLISG